MYNYCKQTTWTDCTSLQHDAYLYECVDTLYARLIEARNKAAKPNMILSKFDKWQTFSDSSVCVCVCVCVYIYIYIYIYIYMQGVKVCMQA